MKKLYFFAAAATTLLAMNGCSDDRDFLSTEGKLMLTASFNNDVKVASRASLEEELSESTIVWISSEKGLVRKYEGLANVPVDGIKLLGGNYVAEAWAGDSLSASFDKKYYKGRAPFTITSGVTRVELKCNIANVVTSIKYDDAVDDVLSDYTFTIGHRRGSLTFEGRDDRKGYFMMPSTDKDLAWTLTGKTADGSTFTKEGVITEAKPATEYVVNVRYSAGADDPLGAGYLTIVVDDKTIDIEDNIEIVSAPTIQGVGYDIANNVNGQPGAVGKKSVYITGATTLKNVVVESADFTSIISGPDVDLMTATQNVLEALNNAGIEWTYNVDADQDISNLKLNFNAEYLDALASGEHSFKVTATDSNNKSTTATLTVNITDALVEPNEVAPDALTTYATSATITGTVLKDEVTGMGFDYRELGTTDWLHVDAIASRAAGTTFSAVLTGLKPGTTYEYRATATDFVNTAAKRFTTEQAVQLPNAGFEDWQVKTGRNATLIYKEGDQMFWDSGNHGSAKMSKNVTVPSSEHTHSGQYSAKLESQYVGVGVAGAFAAGNIFIGQFLGVESVTKGILGWGRQFTSRPKALRGYIKYTPQPVTHSKCDYISEGDMDQGIIYIALVDNSTMTYGSYSGWPQIVATKDPANYLFDKSKSNVIAYGEKIWTTATEGEAMVEFEIPLEYFRTDVKPSNIIVTCSASRYGDYYSGGPSIMYLDDFELVY